MVRLPQGSAKSRRITLYGDNERIDRTHPSSYSDTERVILRGFNGSLVTFLGLHLGSDRYTALGLQWDTGAM